MVKEQNGTNSVANGGGQGSAVGNTLVYSLPTTPSGCVGKVTKLRLINRTGAAAEFLLDDSITIATVMGATPKKTVVVLADEDKALTEEELGEFYIVNGLVFQIDIGATGTGGKVEAEVDVIT